MRTIEIAQNTPEWIEFRRLKIGASDCPVIMKHSPFKSPLELWQEKVLQKECVETPPMRKGSELEAVAREMFERKMGFDIFPCIAVSAEFDWMIASLDGYNIEKNMVVEIKCPGEKVFIEVMNGKIPPYWIWQIQHQLYVTRADSAILCVYFDDAIHTKTILPIDDMWKRLVKAEAEFYDLMIRQVMPPLTERDFQSKSDPEWEKAAKEWRVVKKSLSDAQTILDELKTREKMAREKLIALTDNQSSKGFGVVARLYFERGRVDYDQVDALKGVDLEPFRKKGSWKWRLSETDPS